MIHDIRTVCAHSTPLHAQLCLSRLHLLSRTLHRIKFLCENLCHRVCVLGTWTRTSHFCALRTPPTLSDAALPGVTVPSDINL